MPALGSIFANGDAQKGTWLNTSGGTTGNFWELIDEAISSANDSDYIRGPAGTAATGGTQVYDADLTDTPSDFGVMTSLSYNVRYRQFNRSDDTLGFTLLIESSSGTAYTNTVTFSAVTATSFTSSGATAFTLTSAGLAASKSDWDSAVLVVGQTYSASMANDNAWIAISAVELTGVYGMAKTASGSGAGSSTTISFVTGIRTASASGIGSSVSDELLDTRRIVSSTGQGSSTVASNFTRPGSYDDVLIDSYDDINITYDNAVTNVVRTASASGVGSSSSNQLVTRLRTASSSGLGSNATSSVTTRGRTATSSGIGSSSASAEVVVPRTASGSGTGSSDTSSLRTVPRTVSDSGVGSSVAQVSGAITRTASSSGVGSSSLIQVRSVSRTSSVSGLGSSLSVVVRTVVRTIPPNVGVGSGYAIWEIFIFRTAESNGVGSSLVLSGKSTTREASSHGQSSVQIATWRNAGVTLNESIKMPPFWVDAHPKFIRRRR